MDDEIKGSIPPSQPATVASRFSADVNLRLDALRREIVRRIDDVSVSDNEELQKARLLSHQPIMLVYAIHETLISLEHWLDREEISEIASYARAQSVRVDLPPQRQTGWIAFNLKSDIDVLIASFADYHRLQTKLLHPSIIPFGFDIFNATSWMSLIARWSISAVRLAEQQQNLEHEACERLAACHAATEWLVNRLRDHMKAHWNQRVPSAVKGIRDACEAGELFALPANSRERRTNLIIALLLAVLAAILIVIVTLWLTYGHSPK